MQIKHTISPGHNILKPGQPVPGCNYQPPGSIATRIPIFQHWMTPARKAGDWTQCLLFSRPRLHHLVTKAFRCPVNEICTMLFVHCLDNNNNNNNNNNFNHYSKLFYVPSTPLLNINTFTTAFCPHILVLECKTCFHIPLKHQNYHGNLISSHRSWWKTLSFPVLTSWNGMAHLYGNSNFQTVAKLAVNLKNFIKYFKKSPHKKNPTLCHRTKLNIHHINLHITTDVHMWFCQYKRSVLASVSGKKSLTFVCARKYLFFFF